MSKVKVEFNEAGAHRWADKVWEPQFTPKAGEVREVSPELAKRIVALGKGKLVEEKPEGPANELVSKGGETKPKRYGRTTRKQRGTGPVPKEEA